MTIAPFKIGRGYFFGGDIFKTTIKIILIIGIAVMFFGIREVRQNLSNELKDYNQIVRLKEYEQGPIMKVYKGKDLSTQQTHIIQIVKTKGYKGMIQLLVCINMEMNKITKVEVLSHHETKEYGGYVEQNWFLERFTDKAINKPLKVVKIIAESPDEIVAITGATKTSSAVVGGINLCLENYRDIKGVE